MVLVDSSVWIRHFRERDPVLVRLLADGEVVQCDVVVGELMLGSGISPAIRALLDALPGIEVVTSSDCLGFIDDHDELSRLGIGWADVQVLASCRAARVRLYTHDRALRAAAGRARVQLVGR